MTYPKDMRIGYGADALALPEICPSCRTTRWMVPGMLIKRPDPCCDRMREWQEEVEAFGMPGAPPPPPWVREFFEEMSLWWEEFAAAMRAQGRTEYARLMEEPRRQRAEEERARIPLDELSRLNAEKALIGRVSLSE